MSINPALYRTASAPGLLTVCLLVGLSACQRPVAQFQRSNREVFYSPAPKQLADKHAGTLPADQQVDSISNVPDETERTRQPLAYAEANRPAESTGRPMPTQHTYPIAERIRQHQSNARRLLTPNPVTAARPVSAPVAMNAVQPGPKPKKKTLREILGLPARKKLNWWQRISWQLKASIVVISIALVFAILNVTILAIIFGVIGALLLIRGLKKSFKVKRPWF
ncbi:hypothetical protein [Fibrella aquatica]|uniref:hypothetical protein n=1 Tax=Fibrella aquatica TaxID=3242487 RepID=UPI0035206705